MFLYMVLGHTECVLLVVMSYARYVEIWLFYGTAMFMYMGPRTNQSALQEKIISLFYSLINPTLNPLIYSLRKKQVKGALVNMKRGLGEKKRFS